MTQGPPGESPLAADAAGAYAILERMPYGVLVHDERGVIKFANAYAAKLVGNAALTGREIGGVFAPPFLKGLRHGLLAGSADASEIRPRVHEHLMRADGTQLEVELAAVPFLAGGEGHVQLMFHAVSRRKSRTQTSGRVMVVDDDVLLRRVARRVLEHLGYEVIEAADGHSALTLFEQEPSLTCVLLDLGLPVLTGEVVLHRMLATRPDVRVVLCTGYMHDDKYVANLVGLGRIGFLRKPFGVEDLSFELQKVLR